jgi:hypothetical protein
MDSETTNLIWTIIAIVAIFYILTYFMSCKENMNNMSSTTIGGAIGCSNRGISSIPANSDTEFKSNQVPVNAAPLTENFQSGGAEGDEVEPQPNDEINEIMSSDLLPGTGDGMWGDSTPQTTTAPELPNLEGDQYLQCGYLSGINTVGSSLRNANQQIRNDPIIAMKDVGPWNQTTIEPDMNRKALEIGATA